MGTDVDGRGKGIIGLEFCLPDPGGRITPEQWVGSSNLSGCPILLITLGSSPSSAFEVCRVFAT